MDITMTYSFDGWDEKAIHEAEGELKMARAEVKKSYTGGFEGKGMLEYTMVYLKEGKASYTGLERMVGSIGDKQGSFVVRDIGIYEDAKAVGRFEILAESGTGDFVGIRGQGEYGLGESGGEYKITWKVAFVNS